MRDQRIRYSDALPVEKMSIRDSTTIDGLIHMQVTSQCSADSHVGSHDSCQIAE